MWYTLFIEFERKKMPPVTEFYQVVIRMNYSEHNPPHVHAEYKKGQYKAAFDLDGKMMVGYIPNRERRLVQAWIEIHRDEIMDNWTRIENGEPVCKIDPLQ
jgi:hypothetical protein